MKNKTVTLVKHTEWISEERRVDLIGHLKMKLDYLQRKLAMLEETRTCSDCHYGQNKKYCSHSARRWPFDVLEIKEGFVNCAYYSKPYCETCGTEEPPVTDYEGFPFCPVCKVQ